MSPLHRRPAPLRALLVALALSLVAGPARAGDYRHPQLSAYDHKSWMPHAKASQFVGHYLRAVERQDAANVKRVPADSPAWRALREQFPVLKGVSAENVVVMNAASPEVQQMMATMGREIPLAGMAIHTKEGTGSGHPHLVAHRSAGWADAPSAHLGRTVLFDTAAGKGFNDSGVFTREGGLEKLNQRNPLLYTLWAAPGNVVRKMGDETKGWFEDKGNSANRGWPCTRFVGHRLSALGQLAAGQLDNPFTGLDEGRASWEAEGCAVSRENPWGHKSRQVGAQNVLSQTKVAPHAMIVMLPAEQYRQVVTGDARTGQSVLGTLDKYLRVPPQ